MTAHPMWAGETCIEGESLCSDYGQFRRKGLVRHEKTRELVRVRADIPDTWFSIPATTESEHGFVTSREDAEGNAEFLFIPHTEQTHTGRALWEKAIAGSPASAYKWEDLTDKGRAKWEKKAGALNTSEFRKATRAAYK